MADFKPESTSSFPEFEIREIEQQKHNKTIRLVESARLGLTVLSLLSALVIVSTSSETLGVYNRTHLGENFFLALWPTDFDIRPTIALVTCGAIILVISAISLAASKIPAVCCPQDPQSSSTDHHRSVTNLSSTLPCPSSHQSCASLQALSARPSITVKIPPIQPSRSIAGAVRGVLSIWMSSHTGVAFAEKARPHYTSPS